ncbi:hypothetical protein Ocin01_10090 [Orchesella cincta]|uniref:Uncharacterized protein n=1 Tax=Orchesella cincta TaxID=48709 RepID=A0A1D2MUK6_ORCCI|nr:hypothetical protein Ocin01_10090 [Orchesella cincta]
MPSYQHHRLLLSWASPQYYYHYRLFHPPFYLVIWEMLHFVLRKPFIEEADHLSSYHSMQNYPLTYLNLLSSLF